MGFLTTALVLGAATAAAATSISAANKAGKKSEAAAKEADQRTKSLEEQLKQRQSQEPKDSAAAREGARQRQRDKAVAASGRRDTIITGSLGIPDAGSSGGDKKALGV